MSAADDQSGAADFISAAPQPAQAISGDPTQRLLTALGRFHRYVAKGQAGAPQQFWSDDCMNQLVAAVELSLEQSWTNIVEALTGTARLLQSYENSEAAPMCIPFLNDSYEILCLMVGDVIVNNQRSGVMEKWRERYDRAVEELTAAGFTLIQDETMEPQPPEPPSEGPVLHIYERPEPDSDLALETEYEPAAEEADTEEEFLPFLKVEEPESADSPPVEMPVHEAPGEDQEVVAALDMLCDELGRLNVADNYVAVFEDVAERVEVLARLAVGQEMQVPETLSRRMAQIVKLAADSCKPADDKFFDAAYAFCEAYMDARKNADSDLARSWLEESDRVIAAMKPAPEASGTPASATPTAGASTPPAPDSAEGLLEIAREAIATGDMAGAKVLALQAVAKLAKSEAGKAETRVRDAEQKFQENAEEIESGRVRIKKAEQDVAESEARVAEGGAELADRRAHVAVMEEKVQGLEKKVSELDEQIRALESLREVERQRVRETVTELAQARAEEQKAEQALATLKEAENSSRAALENTRQHVKDMQRRRLELEESLSRARETLTHHRSSLGDIERTIDQVKPVAKAPEPEQKEDLLF